MPSMFGQGMCSEFFICRQLLAQSVLCWATTQELQVVAL